MNSLLKRLPVITNLHRSVSGMAKGPVEVKIIEKLSTSFQPLHLDVLNESNNHNVPKGSETHFKVVIVSDSFDKLPLIKRHRSVNQVLQEELSSGVHALSITAKTPQEWGKNPKAFQSPPCRGGAGL